VFVLTLKIYTNIFLKIRTVRTKYGGNAGFRVQDNIVEAVNQVDENVELNTYFAEGFADFIVE
jgi:hypothetical protein